MNSLDCDSGLRQHQEKVADGYCEHQPLRPKGKGSMAGLGAQDAEEGAGAGTAVILQARGGQNRS